MCRNPWWTGVVAIMMFASGCQKDTPVSKAPDVIPEPEPAVLPAPKPVRKDPTQIALAAKDEMFRTLIAKLLDAVGRDGPVGAIEICGKEAPKIADRIGKQFDVQIGRTSFKLRNSKNLPPDWAKPLLEDKPTEPRFVDLPDNHTGALFPIMLKIQCLACHGPTEQISPDVKAQLDRLYPDDQATGFDEGDLRGWFWVDVPAARLESTSESSAK